MAWSLKENVEQHSKDPVLRANTELALKELGESDPQKAAYKRALLNNDVKTVEKHLLARDIERLQKKAHDPIMAKLLNSQINRLKELEAS